MMSTMLIAVLSPWFGSKRNLAPAIAEELGPHVCYWEPFCGSMAVLLFKLAVSQETVNDMHGELINLARVIQDPCLGPLLYRRCRRVFACREFMEEAAARFRARGNRPAGDTPDLDRAYDYFLASWLGRNGVAGTQSFNQGFSRRFTRNGGHSATRWVLGSRFHSRLAGADAERHDSFGRRLWTDRAHRGRDGHRHLLRSALLGRDAEFGGRLRPGTWIVEIRPRLRG